MRLCGTKYKQKHIYMLYLNNMSDYWIGQDWPTVDLSLLLMFLGFVGPVITHAVTFAVAMGAPNVTPMGADLSLKINNSEVVWEHLLIHVTLFILSGSNISQLGFIGSYTI